MPLSKFRPTPEDERAVLHQYEAKALAQNVLLRGEKSRVLRDKWFVVARRADTRESLYLSFEVTIYLATNLPAFEAALVLLLTNALATLANEETPAPATLQLNGPLL